MPAVLFEHTKITACPVDERSSEQERDLHMQQNTGEHNEAAHYSDDRPLPLGLMMALAQNMQAMKQYAALDEAGRQRLIERAANTHSREQMQSLVEHISDFLS